MSDIAKIQDIEWYSEVPRSIRRQMTAGIILLGATFGGFGAWAFTAPLAAAVIAQGSFVATGRNKVVQHYEGGIIKELLVSEGDEVVEGQPLVRLDETAALAKERELFLRRVRLEATAARLTSLFEDDEHMDISGIAEKHRNDPDVSSILMNQQLNFKALRLKQSNELSLLRQNIKALEFRSEGYARQRVSIIRQLELLGEEQESKKKLLAKALIRETELKAIQRAMADAEGQIGRLESEVAETQAQIVKGRQEIGSTEQTYREDALDRLQAIQGELDTVREQSRQAENVLRRVTINAPVTGTVVRTHYHTAGGVIESGKGIMEILPAGVPLIIEAQIPRNNIDSVSVGQTATVRLVALNQRTTPVLHGNLFYISADALEDSKPGMPAHDVYLARVNIPAEEFAKVKGFHPTPGMPAEVMIQTEKRTFFSYIVKPITDSMSRAFTER
ncbi:HlyD family type I secretion periplasmic adaptor subunit [Rhizobium sp. TRM96647]|uniref:HlyD family type I secretion periplasmic adaptor subunit n=1 Tax=unclassified Rhizobium TaxID=2613769 RepID=UPI0021E73B6E|nr:MULTISPECIES: HlyD family type I secretion periplasmic adaptor subunit [unclassified Rhizobium]MCV3739458.1 HlyD family type I secretion periplasmic adaptor subunit [Rhizobium sp. TRM96647]MCV3761119.1 HlyD family type I secretion periplasmic adaptor subunit [Rhizobium sp. TRM96650]